MLSSSRLTMPKPTTKPSKRSPTKQPAVDAPSATRALQVTAVAAGAALSPAMKAFNRALARIDKLKAQIAELDSIGLAYQAKNKAVLDPLIAKLHANTRSLVVLLDRHLTTPIVPGKRPLLTKTQRETAIELVTQLAESFAVKGDDPVMTEIYNRHSSTTATDVIKADQADFQAMLESLLTEMGGQMPDTTDPETGETVPPEVLLLKVKEELERLEHAEHAQRAERTTKRQARKAQSKPDSAQAQAVLSQEQAAQTLKTMFRQIASRLHPDREPDETERQRKTALMSQANAAYERKDLVALMHIQLEAELVDAHHASRLSAERLNALTLLLKQQGATLDAERQMLQEKWSDILQVPFGMPLTASLLDEVLQQRQTHLEQSIASQEADLQGLQADETQIKPFLNEQRRQIKAEEKERRLFDTF